MVSSGQVFLASRSENDSIGQWVISIQFQLAVVLKCQMLPALLSIFWLQRLPDSKNKLNFSPEFGPLRHILSIQEAFTKCVSNGGHQNCTCQNHFSLPAITAIPENVLS